MNAELVQKPPGNIYTSHQLMTTSNAPTSITQSIYPYTSLNSGRESVNAASPFLPPSSCSTSREKCRLVSGRVGASSHDRVPRVLKPARHLAFQWTS